MTARTRAALQSLPAYQPGRTSKLVELESGITNAIKLSGNESGFGPLPGVLDAMSSVHSLNRYPDYHATELRDALAARFSVDARQIVAGNGSLHLCRSVVEATADAGDDVMMPALSFPGYAAAAVIAGAQPVRVPLRDHTVDLEAMLDRMTPRTRLMFVCTPNNPTSTAISRRSLDAFLAEVPEDVLVVLDEAYVDFMSGDDLVDGLYEVSKRSNVMVLRTFSKAYGLAALRIGFSISSPEVAAVLRKVTIPFAVSALSEAAAIASLHDHASAELQGRITDTIAERERVTRALHALGFEVPASQANFVWLPLGNQAEDFARTCESHGVIVRGFPGTGVRVTIGLQCENDAFLDAATQIAASR